MKMTKRLLWMARKHWGTLIIAVLGLIGAAVLNLVTPSIIQQLTRALQTPDSMMVNTLITFVVILVAAYLLRAVCRFVAMSISMGVLESPLARMIPAFIL